MLEATGLGPQDAPAGGEELAFFTVAPCRIVDTRAATGAFAGPTEAFGACPTGRWVIRPRAEACPALFEGDRYHVLVIKNP